MWLVLEGSDQPSYYTEPILHEMRLREKKYSLLISFIEAIAFFILFTIILFTRKE